jgi:hypothetical protein
LLLSLFDRFIPFSLDIPFSRRANLGIIPVSRVGASKKGDLSACNASGIGATSQASTALAKGNHHSSSMLPPSSYDHVLPDRTKQAEAGGMRRIIQSAA